jgi:CheY-like chemotaxis protein
VMNKHDVEPVAILMADDDSDDRLLTKYAFTQNHIANPLFFVDDGVNLLDYLGGKGEYADRERFPLPGLILLDLNMPRMDGREALEEIKKNDQWRQIPVVVLTTSTAEEDVVRSYYDGAAGFISKPVTFQGLTEVIKGLTEYWLQIVRLPQPPEE